MGNYDSNEFYYMQELVRMCITFKEIDKRLQICFNLCQMMVDMTLDEKATKFVKDMQAYSQKKLMDADFRKKIFRRAALMEREPIAYFEDGNPKDDIYDFDAELEEEVTEVDFKVTTFVGNVSSWIQGQSGTF